MAHRYSLLGGGTGHAVFAKKKTFFRKNWVYKFVLSDQTRRKLSEAVYLLPKMSRPPMLTEYTKLPSYLINRKPLRQYRILSTISGLTTFFPRGFFTHILIDLILPHQALHPIPFISYFHRNCSINYSPNC